MMCMKCGKDENNVVETRGDPRRIYRRRRCVCGHKFWTGEAILDSPPPQHIAQRRLASLKEHLARKVTADE